MDGGISLSPPFVISVTISSTGLIAAGLANGFVWIGGGGEKPSGPQTASKKKRSRKWEGLNEHKGIYVHAADGPIVAMQVKFYLIDLHTQLTTTFVAAFWMRTLF